MKIAFKFLVLPLLTLSLAGCASTGCNEDKPCGSSATQYVAPAAAPVVEAPAPVVEEPAEPVVAKAPVQKKLPRAVMK